MPPQPPSRSNSPRRPQSLSRQASADQLAGLTPGSPDPQKRSSGPVSYRNGFTAWMNNAPRPRKSRSGSKQHAGTGSSAGQVSRQPSFEQPIMGGLRQQQSTVGRLSNHSSREQLNQGGLIPEAPASAPHKSQEAPQYAFDGPQTGREGSDAHYGPSDPSWSSYGGGRQAKASKIGGKGAYGGFLDSIAIATNSDKRLAKKIAKERGGYGRY